MANEDGGRNQKKHIMWMEKNKSAICTVYNR